VRAADLSRLIEGAREYRPGKYHAPCPLHGGKSGTSFAFEDAEDGSKVLAICRAGCPIEDVVRSVGIELGNLFSDTSRNRDPAAEHRALAARGLERWRSVSLNDVCVLFRDLEFLAAGAANLLSLYQETNTGTAEERDEVWNRLAFAYHQISRLESDFERLNSRDRGDHLAVWREIREAQNAA
jgi:hypothetical protein